MTIQIEFATLLRTSYLITITDLQYSVRLAFPVGLSFLGTYPIARGFPLCSDSMDSQESSNLLFILLGLFIVYKMLVKQCRRTGINVSFCLARPLLAKLTKKRKTHIPTFGYQGYLLSYIDAINFLFNGPTLLMAGYKKVRGRELLKR